LLRSRLEIGLESLYRLPVAKGIYLSFTPKSLYRLPVAKGIYLSFTPKSLYRLPVAKGIYLSFTPQSLRRTPYHAGLSLIYNRRVCGGPPTTQVYLSFTTEEFAEDPLPRRFISHLQPFNTASKFVQHTRQAGISLTSL